MAASRVVAVLEDGTRIPVEIGLRERVAYEYEWPGRDWDTTPRTLRISWAAWWSASRRKEYRRPFEQWVREVVEIEPVDDDPAEDTDTDPDPPTRPATPAGSPVNSPYQWPAQVRTTGGN